MSDPIFLEENASNPSHVQIITVGGVESAGDPGDQELPELLPILPLRAHVLFPGTMAPLNIERKGSRKLLDDQLPQSRLVGLVTQLNQDIDEPKAEQLFGIGVLGNVLRMIQNSDDSVLILVQVMHRIRLTKFVESKDEPYLKAKFEVLESSTPDEMMKHGSPAFAI